MEKVSLVVFDIAGTTIKENVRVGNAFAEVFRKFEMEILPDDIKKVRGYRKLDAIRMLLERYYPEKMLENEDLVNEIHVAFKQNLISFYESAIDLKPQTGAEQVFLWLRMHNIKVALNTGFPSSVTDIILQRLGWKNGDLIDQVISGDEVQEGRPAPFMINELMKRLGVENASEVVKVGDTEVDISEGRNARCGIVASVTTGACNRKQLEACGPDYVIDDLREIQVIIEKSGRTAGT